MRKLNRNKIFCHDIGIELGIDQREKAFINQEKKKATEWIELPKQESIRALRVNICQEIP